MRFSYNFNNFLLWMDTNLITKNYEKGVRLTKNAMNKIEESIHRICGIEKWAVDILCYSE